MVLILTTVSALFVQSAANLPTDFKYDLTKDGTGVVIQGYLGENAQFEEEDS